MGTEGRPYNRSIPEAVMDMPYPAGPASVPGDFTKATASYRRMAWLALGGLLLFMALYLWLSAWFVRQGWRLIAGTVLGGGGFWPVVAGLASLFLAVFMLKALFFVRHGGEIQDLEVRPEEEPALFAFLHRLADEAGAPRPHRVFLSPRVNAAVFYDLTLLNLVWPSKKNLEIGLPLVNALNLGELKAVLAHEFGHFAQKSMAVGRWVYIAQQIAGQVIARRDMLDRFLAGLCSVDFRVAWVGWLLSLVVWAIRALMDTAFRLVVLAQRALSREMEMQADRVSVSLTGSEALVNALHRMESAEDSWERTLSFADRQLRKDRILRDFFATQRRVVEHLRRVLNEPRYGLDPLPAEGDPAARRIFRVQFARPPRMWATHPLNHEREENAKRVYLAAPEDARSAWSLFQDPEAAAERMSAHLARDITLDRAQALAPAEESMAALDEEFRALPLDPGYRGTYLGRSVTRRGAKPADLLEPVDGDLAQAIADLYPETLSGDLESRRELDKERMLLEALQRGLMDAEAGQLRHRGKAVRKSELPRILASVKGELEEVETRLAAHDRRCRSIHRAAAAGLGSGWAPYLDGLLALLHYADHSHANLLDAHGAYGSVLEAEMATGKVSRDGVNQIIAWGNALHGVLANIHRDGPAVVPPPELLASLGAASWGEALGEFKLPPAGLENINDWAKHLDSWVRPVLAALVQLRDASLDALLRAEASVARAYRDGRPLDPVPPPPNVPAAYATLLPGRERERPGTRTWWVRFQTADGPFATVARLTAAGLIMAGMLGAGRQIGQASLSIYNGLNTTVTVRVDGAKHTLPSLGTATVELDPTGGEPVQAVDEAGRVIESFVPERDGGLGHYVYNVAGASPLVAWTATYGSRSAVPERYLGAPRWMRSEADVFFAEPPKQIETSKTSGGGTREVVTGFGERSPEEMLSLLRSEDRKLHEGMILAHARWDHLDSPHLSTWLAAASGVPGFEQILAARIQEHPRAVVLLRAEQEAAHGADKAAVAARHQELARREPANPDLAYLAIRSMEDGEAQDHAFLEAHDRWPRHPWLTYAVAFHHAQRGEWEEAGKAYEQAAFTLPALADQALLQATRIRRLLGREVPQTWTQASPVLRALKGVEDMDGLAPEPLAAYVALHRGHLDIAKSKAKADPALARRILRLSAASDGASPALAAHALALAPADLDPDTSWVMLALALREKRDPAPYRAFADSREEWRTHLLAWADGLAAGASPASLEPHLRRLDAVSRGRAYGMGAIILGRRAPASWRTGAMKLLFASERPYFRN